MEYRLNNIFDKVVCLNLLERPDKKEFMQTQFDKFGINVNWFTAVKYGFSNIINQLVTSSKIGYFNINQPNEVGCSISFYTIIKKTLLEGNNNLFIFEDDAHLHKDFNNLFNKYFHLIPSNWDMFQLYSYVPPQVQLESINEYWNKSNKCWSNVAIGMNKRFMEHYIDFMDNHFSVADMPTFQLQNILNCYLVKDYLVIPSDILKSDIRQFKNYESFNNNINKMNFI